MPRCVEKLSHECGSSDALQIFYSESQDTYTGYCFACDTYVPNPYEGERKRPAVRLVKTPEQIEQEMKEIDALPTVTLYDRKLNKASLEYFNIKISLSQQDGKTPIMHHYPYTKDGKRVGYVTRMVEGKRFWSVGDVKNSDIFGWEQALSSGAKTLYITEGALDAVTVYQVLMKKQRGTKYEDFIPAVVSISGASYAMRQLTRHQNDINALFNQVVLVFDQDEAGQQAVQAAMQIFPDAISATLPEKDPNDCLTKGREQALVNAILFRATKPKNTRLINAQSLFAKAAVPVPMGISWPWEGLTELTRGIRLGETCYLGAGVKMGKSTVVNILASDLMLRHDMRILLAKPEEPAEYTTRLVCGQAVGRIFHDPKVEFDHEAYAKANELIKDKLVLIDQYQHVGWKSLRADIIEAAEEGCQAVFIDPITNLTNAVASAEANTVLQGVAQDLAAIAKDKNLMIFIFCHLKAPEVGPPHERGGKVMSHQFAGSRAMMRSCNLMLGLEGNKDPDLDDMERNVRRLVVLEDRQFGASGYINLFYDEKTGLLNEMKR